MQHVPVDGGLIVFLRLPQWGKVKTRLAATLGDDVALSIYKGLISHTLHCAARSGKSVYLFYDGGLPSEAERNPDFSYHIQSQGDLGAKMSAAISIVLKHHTKVVIIGSDCPKLSHDIIAKSFDSLDTTDIVVGPAKDGGYYLLGCKKVVDALFENIPWSTSMVLAQTIKKINDESLTFHLLEPLADIDTEEDWNRYITGQL